MSFFYDFLNYFKVDDFETKTSIMTVIGVGIMIVGKIKLLNLSENLIEVKSGKDKIFVYGENLLVKSISKGEIVLSGNVCKIETGEL